MKKKKYTTPLVAYVDIVPPQMIATSVSEQVINDDEQLMDGQDALVKNNSWQDVWQNSK